jgi:hypothetical protein
MTKEDAEKIAREIVMDYMGSHDEPEDLVGDIAEALLSASPKVPSNMDTEEAASEYGFRARPFDSSYGKQWFMDGVLWAIDYRTKKEG